MSSKAIGEGASATLQVTNIGGIDQTTVDIPPGVTILSGRNATNRTSLLQAIMAATGSDQATLKGDAEEGRVELEIEGNSYTRTLSRTGSESTLTLGGDPYLNNPSEAELFAFLLETNEVRQAVQHDDDLRDIIMRPVDTDEIQREISRLEQEKRNLEQQLSDLDNLEQQLPDHEARRKEIEIDIEEKQEELRTKEAEIDNADVTVTKTREEKTTLENKLDELRNARSRLEDIRYDIETKRESLDEIQNEQDDLQKEYTGLPEPATDELESLSEELDQIRAEKDRLETDLNEVQRLIQFNEDMLDEGVPPVLASANEETASNDDGDVTDQLLETTTETVTCWTCGTAVDNDQIEVMVDRLRDLRKRTLSDINDREDKIDDLKTKQQELRETQQRREEIEQRLKEIDEEIDTRQTTLDDLKTEQEELTEAIEDLEDEIENLEDETYTEILDLHKEANQLEFEINRLETKLKDENDEIARINGKLDQRGDLEQQLEDIQDQLTELRTRIDQLEAQAVEEFNEHMESVLDLLGYENLERIWLERKETQVQEGRRKVEKTVFDLHVVRSTEEGTTYEDTIVHLSESEREVTGLVFALAGYLTHEVYETVPFMLLDSIEALDSDRIAALVSHLRDFAPYLVIALLPEDATALDDDYHYITEI